MCSAKGPKGSVDEAQRRRSVHVRHHVTSFAQLGRHLRISEVNLRYPTVALDTDVYACASGHQESALLGGQTPSHDRYCHLTH